MRTESIRIRVDDLKKLSEVLGNEKKKTNYFLTKTQVMHSILEMGFNHYCKINKFTIETLPDLF